MPRRVRIGLLLDLYGSLLTEKQREFVRLHYDEDQTYGEIAQSYQVSRQAIHDAVKHAERSLQNYEDRLKFLERGMPKIREAVGRSPLPEGAEATELEVEQNGGEGLAAGPPEWAGAPGESSDGASSPPSPPLPLRRVRAMRSSEWLH